MDCPPRFRIPVTFCETPKIWTVHFTSLNPKLQSYSENSETTSVLESQRLGRFLKCGFPTLAHGSKTSLTCATLDSKQTDLAIWKLAQIWIALVRSILHSVSPKPKTIHVLCTLALCPFSLAASSHKLLEMQNPLHYFATER